MDARVKPAHDTDPFMPQREDTPTADAGRSHQTEKSFADGKILQSVSDGVGVITFNNPEKRNAMSLDMWEGLVTR